MADDKMTPMGGNVPEDRDGRAEALLNRNCWAIDTLIAEVTEQFTVEVETSEPNWVNANKVVTFKPPMGSEWEDLSTLLAVVGEDDERIAFTVLDDDAGTITITMTMDVIGYDTRDSFGISSAALGLDRELTPDDLTELAADIASGGEGFIESDGSA